MFCGSSWLAARNGATCKIYLNFAMHPDAILLLLITPCLCTIISIPALNATFAFTTPRMMIGLYKNTSLAINFTSPITATQDSLCSIGQVSSLEKEIFFQTCVLVYGFQGIHIFFLFAFSFLPFLALPFLFWTNSVLKVMSLLISHFFGQGAVMSPLVGMRRLWISVQWYFNQGSQKKFILLLMLNNWYFFVWQTISTRTRGNIYWWIWFFWHVSLPTSLP